MRVFYTRFLAQLYLITSTNFKIIYKKTRKTIFILLALFIIPRLSYESPGLFSTLLGLTLISSFLFELSPAVKFS